MAKHRSIDMAINVFTDAETETPWKYETVLQKNAPRVQAENQKKKNLLNFYLKLDFYTQNLIVGHKYFPKYHLIYTPTPKVNGKEFWCENCVKRSDKNISSTLKHYWNSYVIISNI